MSKITRTPIRYRVASFIARRNFQPLWRGLNALSYWGMGYNNWISRLNGEDAFAQAWAAARAGTRPVIFDIGANEGDFTGNLLSHLPEAQFHLFEPNPQTFYRLALAYGEYPNVQLNSCGIGSGPGRQALYDFRGGQGSERASFLPETFSVLLKTDPDNIRRDEVAVVSLDDYCAARAIPRIDFLKIDTEGYEKFVLEGARGLLDRGAIDTIQLEFNEQNVISGLNLFRLHEMAPGFDIHRLLPDGMAPVLVGRNGYDTRFDIPKYCNFVLRRRGLA